MRIKLEQLLEELTTRVKIICKKARENLGILEVLDQYASISIEELKKKRDEYKKRDENLRDYGDELENLVAKIFSLQAPVGRDLRLTLSSFRIIYEFERISMETRNIAQYFLQIQITESPRPVNGDLKEILSALQNAIPSIYKIFDIFTEYFGSSHKYLETGRIIAEVKDLDKVLDVLFREKMRGAKIGGKSGLVVHNAFILSLRAVERIGDHGCNVIERMCYIINGARVKI